MTKRKSNQVGVLNGEEIGIRLDSPSTNGEQSSILGMSDTTAKVKSRTGSQLTPNSLANPVLTHAKIISVFAAKLGALVEWRKIELPDGRKGYALFFDTRKWIIDPISIELTPLGVK